MLRFSGTYKNETSDIFTGRMKEFKALVGAMTEHRANILSDIGTRHGRNLLVFHGVGGIGKTTLSKRLEAWLNDSLPTSDPWGSAPSHHGVVTGRYDLHDSKGNVDVGEIVLTLRRAVGEIKNRWPAFDLAFSAWWAASHMDNSEPTLQKPGNGTVHDAMISTLTEILSDVAGFNTGMGLTVRLTRKAVQVVIQRRDREFGASIGPSRDYYYKLLERVSQEPSPDNPRVDLLIEIARLLDGELALMPVKPEIVVFIDTFENVQKHDDHERLAESFFNKLIWSLPRILFVVTGRNSLGWARDGRRGVLPYCGPRHWPVLAQDTKQKPQQYLVGRLSLEASMELLDQVRKSLHLPLTDENLQQIAIRADGFPMHIDLILAEFTDRFRDGIELFDPEILDMTFDELVVRLLKDVPVEEQRVLRYAVLFSSFDAGLLVQVSGQETGCVLRALKRPIVETVQEGDFTHRIHDEIRRAIREYDPLAPGGWAEADWQKAANQAMVHYETQVRNALATNDYTKAMRNIGAAISLACEEDVRALKTDAISNYADWLAEKVILGPGIASLRPHVPVSSANPYGKGFIDFIRSKYAETPINESGKILKQISSSDHPLALPAMRHYAYALRAQERFDEAMHVFDYLKDKPPVGLHCFQRQSTLSMARRFNEALRDIEGELRDEEQDFERLEARIRAVHGNIEDYIRLWFERAQKLMQRNRKREADELRHSALIYTTLCKELLDPKVLQNEFQNALTEQTPNGLRDVNLLCVLNDPFNPNSVKHLKEMERVDKSRFGRIEANLALGQVAWAWVNEQPGELAKVAEQLQSQTHLASSWVRVEILLDLLGYRVDVPAAQWLEPYGTVQKRWINHWENWRTRVIAQG